MSLIGEVTERARKLRNQYKLQAQSLRARIEMRINRVPSSLRRTQMGDLNHAHTGPTKPAERSDQMNINEPQNEDTKIIPPHQFSEVLDHAKKPSADLRSQKAKEKMDITSRLPDKPTPVRRPVTVLVNKKSAERIKPQDNVDQNNIYAWRESKSCKPVAKPVPASINQKATEKPRPVVKVDISDIRGPTDIISGRETLNTESAERVIELSNNSKAKPMSTLNMAGINEPPKGNSVQLSDSPAPVERPITVSNVGTTTSAHIRGVKRKR